MIWRLTLTSLLSAAAVGCGPSTGTLEYGGHVLEPASVIFAHIPLAERSETVMIVSDQGNYCTLFDGLSCLPQPHVGTTLLFRFPGFEVGERTVGQNLEARWLDFQGVRPLDHEANAGRILIREVKEEDEMVGDFDIRLPEGRLDDGFTARYCQPLRDYYLGCRDSR
jgi:hypothetical protein